MRQWRIATDELLPGEHDDGRIVCAHLQSAIIKALPMTASPPTKLRQATKTFVDNSGLLILGTVIALVWANLDPARATQQLSRALHFVVNDIGMAFFFALAAKEVVEATAPGGALHSPRRAAHAARRRHRRHARPGPDLSLR